MSTQMIQASVWPFDDVWTYVFRYGNVYFKVQRAVKWL